VPQHEKNNGYANIIWARMQEQLACKRLTAGAFPITTIGAFLFVSKSKLELVWSV